MNWVAVLPWVFEPYRDECVATIAPEFWERTLEVNNSITNIGCMKSHNLGVEWMKLHQAAWLIIISPAIRFGPQGGMDFAQILEDRPDYQVIHAASANVPGGTEHGSVNDVVNEIKGWHLTAFHRTVFDNVGIWDENFTPYSLDDIDLSIRIRKFYGQNCKWDTFPCDVHDTGIMGHSLNLAGVQSKYHPRNSYFARKWGREGGEYLKPAYDNPFNDPVNKLSYWPKPDDPLSIMQNEFAEDGGYEKEPGWI